MRNVIIGFAIAAPFLAIALWTFSPALAIGALFLSHMLVLVPTLCPNLQWLGPVVTRFETGGREVWLTIDDGPAGDTGAILDLLDEFGARATFFVKGLAARERRGEVEEIVRRGHTVGNHSMTHPSGSFWCLPPAAVRREIESAAAVLLEITGVQSQWFRAPVGMKNPFVHPLLERHGVRLIGWTVRGLDGVRGDVDGVVRRIARNLTPGAIVVLHQGRPWSLQTIRSVLEWLRREGYAAVVPDDGRLKTKR